MFQEARLAHLLADQLSRSRRLDSCREVAPEI